jgi:hypothetical protein
MTAKDSIDKIVGSYFSVITEEPYTYKGTTTYPKALNISPLLFRNLECPAKCGACCSRFSLDYLPREKHPEGLAFRNVEFNGYDIGIYSDLQLEGGHFCQHLSQEDARCGIHGYHPFSCDFEIIRSLVHTQQWSNNHLLTKFYGRGWNMLRIDGERGAMCGIYDGFEESRRDVLRKLGRLDQWADYFHLKHRTKRIIEWVRGLEEPPTQATVFG